MRIIRDLKTKIRKLFKKDITQKFPAQYEERDTKCDKCKYFKECELIESTLLSDARRHFVPALGNVCKIDVEGAIKALENLGYTVSKKE